MRGQLGTSESGRGETRQETAEGPWIGQNIGMQETQFPGPLPDLIVNLHLLTRQQGWLLISETVPAVLTVLSQLLAEIGTEVASCTTSSFSASYWENEISDFVDFSRFSAASRNFPTGLPRFGPGSMARTRRSDAPKQTERDR